MEMKRERVIFGILTIYLVRERKAKNDSPINIVCQFHCKQKQIFVT